MKAKIIDTNEIYEFEEIYLKDNPNPFYRRWDGKLYYPSDLDFCFGEKYIRELSKEYSEYMCPLEDYVDDRERETDLSIYQEDAICVLGWLAENYEITINPRKHE